MHLTEDRQANRKEDTFFVQTSVTRNVCRLDRHMVIFLFFCGLFSWPMLTILEGTSNLFDFLYLFIVWLALILLLMRIRRSSLKCLKTGAIKDR